MLDVNQRDHTRHKSSIAHWVYQAIGESKGLRLRTRLRGNDLHILCESDFQCPSSATVVTRILQALDATDGQVPSDPGRPVYQIILYGRIAGRQRPEWIEPIQLVETASDRALDEGRLMEAPSAPANGFTAPSGGGSTPPANGSALLISNETLARSGSTEAIARYLSEGLSPMGVSVKVVIQNLPKGQVTEKSQPPTRRLWVVCDSDYSPDQSLLAETVASRLRNLNLEGFCDAAIKSQVSGEASPDWVLRVDLTPPEEMLKDWARWGDIQAIARLLNQKLAPHDIELRAVLKDVTLHLFCSHTLDITNTPKAPDRATIIDALAPVLEAIEPQGIQAAAVYGVEAHKKTPVPDQETPIWIEWLNLPAAKNPALAETALALAAQGDQGALLFLLQRLLNPDMDGRLATGGIRVQITKKQDLLHIMTEAVCCPVQNQVGAPIAKFVRQLGIRGIVGVRVYGRRAGLSSPLWNYGVDFVSRGRLPQPDLQPVEFAASDVSSDDPTAAKVKEEVETSSAIAKENFNSRFNRWVATSSAIFREWLCYTQLFVSTASDNAWKTPSRTLVTNNSAGDGVKTVLVWGTLGLLLTLQSDWLMGQVLQRQEEQAISGKPVQKEETLESVAIPQLSLQKQSRGNNAKVFNRTGFTKNGETSVIVIKSEKGNLRASGRKSGATAAILASARSLNPSFNNRMLDEKLALYQQRLLQKRGKPPDVLIVGSSRAMRGIDPTALSAALADAGFPNVDVFNFGVNGATAQVVDLIIRQVLTAEQMPKVIIWADGARAFNSGRTDMTYKAIAASPGYQQLNAGTFPKSNQSNITPSRSLMAAQASSLGQTNSPASDDASLTSSYQMVEGSLNQALSQISSTYAQRDQLKTILREGFKQFAPSLAIAPKAENSTNPEENLLLENEIDFDGFLPLSVRFLPTTYYQKYARVSGDYDGDYESFQLFGKQDEALDSLLQFVQERGVPLVFVNLPLTQEYLDPIRTQHEQKFQLHMREVAEQKGLIYRDLSQLWPTKNDFFSDPSHLNRYGAYEVSNQLAQDPMIPWPSK